MTAKEFLNQAYRLNELIDSDVEELERLRDLATRISGPNFESVYRPQEIPTRRSSAIWMTSWKWSRRSTVNSAIW